MSPDASGVPVVHAVTTPELVATPGFVALARQVMAALGARGALQLRDHTATGRALLAIARELADVQDATGCRLVVNDRIDVALACGAWGVQLTSRSILPADARRVAPRLPMGASVHAPDEAREAAAGGVDWVVAGHVFRTASHPGEPGRGSEFLRRIVEAAPALPVVAIGGVTPADVPGLRAVGARGVAVIRGIWDAADPAGAATDYLASYDADVP